MRKLLPIFILLVLTACGGNKDIIDNQPPNQNFKVTRTIPAQLDGMGKVSGKCFAIVPSTGYKKELGGQEIKVIGADTAFSTDIKGTFSFNLKPGKYQLQSTYEKRTVTSNLFKLEPNTDKQFEIYFIMEFTP